MFHVIFGGQGRGLGQVPLFQRKTAHDYNIYAIRFDTIIESASMAVKAGNSKRMKKFVLTPLR